MREAWIMRCGCFFSCSLSIAWSVRCCASAEKVTKYGQPLTDQRIELENEYIYWKYYYNLLVGFVRPLWPWHTAASSSYNKSPHIELCELIDFGGYGGNHCIACHFYVVQRKFLCVFIGSVEFRGICACLRAHANILAGRALYMPMNFNQIATIHDVQQLKNAPYTRLIG